MTPIPAHNSVINYTDNLTKDTIRKVATLAGQFSFDSYVDELAETCTQGTGEKDLVGEISAAFYCVQNRVEWHRDPITGEKIYQPPLLARRVLKFVNGYVAYPPKGDCDDKACLLMCLLLNRGHAARAVGAWQSLIPPYQGCPDPQNPKWKRINHVYIEVKDPGRQRIVDGGTVQRTGGWLPLEPSSESLPPFKQNPAVIPIVNFYATVDEKVIR